MHPLRRCEQSYLTLLRQLTTPLCLYIEFALVGILFSLCLMYSFNFTILSNRSYLCRYSLSRLSPYSLGIHAPITIVSWTTKDFKWGAEQKYKWASLQSPPCVWRYIRRGPKQGAHLDIVVTNCYGPFTHKWGEDTSVWASRNPLFGPNVSVGHGVRNVFSQLDTGAVWGVTWRKLVVMMKQMY